jgi:hypothetical protein
MNRYLGCWVGMRQLQKLPFRAAARRKELPVGAAGNERFTIQSAEPVEARRWHATRECLLCRGAVK